MTQFSMALLGAFDVVADSRSITDFATDKTRALLAYLALFPDRPHRRETLSSLLWSEWPDHDALRNLRKTLHRLRQTIDRAAPGASEQLLEVTRQTILLHSDRLTLDVTVFRQLLAQVEQHAHHALHICDACLEALERAAALYRGELLSGFALDRASLFEDWVAQQRDQLQNQLNTSLYVLADAYLARGEYEKARTHATHQIALDRWNEDAHRQIMTALASSGQRSEALAYYDDLSLALKQELDAPPQPETVALQKILKNGTLLSNDIPQTPIYNVPTPFTPFIGRQPELRTIQAYLLDHGSRLVTLVGPAGIGKTRLSIEAVRNIAAQKNSFGDGIYFVALARVENLDRLISELASAVTFKLQEQPDPHQQLLNHLRTKQCLLVLDNFEHLEDCAPFLSQLLVIASGVQLLVTTHAPLNLQAEQRLFIGSLDYPREDEPAVDVMAYSAVELFVETARRIHPGFTPDAVEQQHIVRICQLVQGIPIALEIAATWVRVCTCQQIAKRIAQDLDFLVTPLQDVPDRHRSMTAVFEHSWDLLTPVQQKILAQLSVFEGEFSTEAMLAVTGEAFSEFGTLVDRSLLRRMSADSYRQHELLREFAAGKLEQLSTPETDLVELTHHRHCTYYLNLAAEHEYLLQGPTSDAVLQKLERTLANIRKAWRWGLNHNQFEAIADSADSLAYMADLAGRFHNAEKILEHAIIRTKAVIEREGESPTALLTLFRFLFWHAHFLNRLGYAEQAISDARQAIAVSEKLDSDTYKALEQTINNTLMPIATQPRPFKSDATDARPAATNGV